MNARAGPERDLAGRRFQCHANGRGDSGGGGRPGGFDRLELVRVETRGGSGRTLPADFHGHLIANPAGRNFPLDEFGFAETIFLRARRFGNAVQDPLVTGLGQHEELRVCRHARPGRGLAVRVRVIGQQHLLLYFQGKRCPGLQRRGHLVPADDRLHGAHARPEACARVLVSIECHGVSSVSDMALVNPIPFAFQDPPRRRGLRRGGRKNAFRLPFKEGQRVLVPGEHRAPAARLGYEVQRDAIRGRDPGCAAKDIPGASSCAVDEPFQGCAVLSRSYGGLVVRGSEKRFFT
ncbi:MAG: hypothetical protein BWY59_01348 [Verrucomicrobia bacterium ADurb.Bin345]|nr:MAG: hypothetical protein BWY59_01348 [Verrucomicrobia bacterium ADurb.Bin345]